MIHVYECFACTYVCALHMSLVLQEFRRHQMPWKVLQEFRKHQMPWNGSFGGL